MVRKDHNFSHGRVIGKQAERKVGGGIPKTATVDDRCIVLQKEGAIFQSASAIAQQLCTATGRQVLRFTVTRHLHKGGLFTCRPDRCVLFESWTSAGPFTMV
ncbi:transposable element Tcb2 transposase [Trichonephila clavipes]|nr:transposable element Tcb2 transposase [Trichonephila clavipes]